MSGTPFTASGSSEAESRVRDDLERIRSVILRSLPAESIEMAALAGGFGRGEGGVIRDNGGVLRAFNDYDVVIFARGNPDTGRLLAAAPALARELEIDFVDFGVLDPVSLERIAPTVFWYEFLEGNRILLGHPDFLKGIPRIDPADLPLVEATRLMINRGMGLLWAWLHLEDAATDGSTFDALRRRFTINAIHKAILAMGDAALIKASHFHVSYRERAGRVAAADLELPPGLPGNFRAAHSEATRFKLYPEISAADPAEFRQWWHVARDWHEHFFRWIEGARLGRPVGTWEKYPHSAAREALVRGVRHPKQFVRDCRTGLPLKSFSRFVLDTELSCRVQLPFLLYGIRQAGLDDALVASGLRGFGLGASQDARLWRNLAEGLIGEWHP